MQKLSFLQFSIQRSLGVLRVGSNPCAKISPEWTPYLRLRNSIDCNPTGSDQLLFNEDGSLLLIADFEKGIVRSFDTKRKQLLGSSLIDLEGQWGLRNIMLSGPNEVVTLCTPRFDDGARLMFWDLRETSNPVASSLLYGQTPGQSSLYSKKDDSILIMNAGDSSERLSVYNRDGVKQHCGFPEKSKWTSYVRNVALSPDETILVMTTNYSSYIIVRQLNLETLFEDLQNFDPDATRAESLAFHASVQDRSSARSSRNVPEYLLYAFFADVTKCLCPRCNRAVVFTPKSDFFIGRHMSFEQYATGRARAPSQDILVFDLREHLTQRCTGHSSPELDGNNLTSRSFLKQPVNGLKMDVQDFLTRAELGYLQTVRADGCTIGACNVAVTKLLDQTVIAVANDFSERVKFSIFNNEHLPVHQLEIMLRGSCVSNMTFSPNNFSLAVADTRNNVHWFDIEHCGPLDNNDRRTSSLSNVMPFDAFEVTLIDLENLLI